MIEATKIYKPREVSRECGCPLRMVLDAIHSGELPHVQRGRNFYIGGASVIAWVSSLGGES